MKIYTRTGDAGDTKLYGGQSVSKACPRVWAYGEIDELNATLGLVRLAPFDEEIDAYLGGLQSRLFDLGAELAAQPGKDIGIPLVNESDIGALEAWIDRLDEELPTLKAFVLPGGTSAAAHLHLARCVCRRAERRVVALGKTEAVRGEVIRFLNRLSDFIFVVARAANHRTGTPDIPWIGRARSAKES